MVSYKALNTGVVGTLTPETGSNRTFMELKYK